MKQKLDKYDEGVQSLKISNKIRIILTELNISWLN